MYASVWQPRSPVVLFALSALALSLAACGGDGASSRTPTSSPPATTAMRSRTPLPPSTALPPETSILLRDVDFVDARTGWAAGAGGIIASTDGGVSWHPQYTNAEASFLKLNFISPLAGWAVAVDHLLGTTDGGNTWTELGEPAVPLVDVYFVSASLGWGVSASNPDLYTNGQVVERKLVTTTDGGLTWSGVTTPAPVQSVCARTASDVWAGAGKDVLHTLDAGATWSMSLTAPVSGDAWTATVECAADGVAWVQFVGYYGVSNHRPHAVYRTLDGGSHWDVMMAEQYTLGDVIPATEVPGGSYPGPFSLVDARTAFVTGFCGPCGTGTTYIRSTVDGGGTWSQDSIVSDAFWTPAAVDFVDVGHGWALFTSNTSEILATADGGRTWIKQYP